MRSHAAVPSAAAADGESAVAADDGDSAVAADDDAVAVLASRNNSLFPAKSPDYCYCPRRYLVSLPWEADAR